MKKCFYLFLLPFLLPLYAMAQSDQHYTMFMYNKLLYNPAYAGSRDVTSVNAVYRDQWDKIDGAPKTINISADGPVGSYMKPFRKVAVAVSMTNEKTGVESNTVLKAYYAYRLQLKQSVLSFGLSAGANLYSAAYSSLNLYQQNDPNFASNIKNAMLPNFGAGAYWFGDNYYAGFSIPNILEDYYDKHEVKLNNKIARQIRGYYLSGGYVYQVNETLSLEPQLLARYAVNSDYKLPFNCDINISAIVYNRFMAGFTYRTDKSLEFIVHVQATKKLNIGYAYDYMMSGMNGYNGGSHELVVGYDFVKDNAKYASPRFTKKF
jgi:type IX secretion system PorP/SprF family membrane protein